MVASARLLCFRVRFYAETFAYCLYQQQQQQQRHQLWRNRGFLQLPLPFGWEGVHLVPVSVDAHASSTNCPERAGAEIEAD